MLVNFNNEESARLGNLTITVQKNINNNNNL